ncbi:MAG: hypothetical protein KAT34_21075, partial [Candidatus Aminicenantes bacterium]|nr:hypothetical protein [Candidatus Aminicenantes bacterium]
MKIKEKYYALELDKDKRCVYLTFLEGGEKPADFPGFLDNIKKIAAQMSGEYTLLLNLLENSSKPSFGTTKLMKTGQNLFQKAGVVKSAIVMQEKFVIQKMFINVTSKLSRVNLKTFSDLDAALTF